MRKSYNIPLNDSSIMDSSISPQSALMPSFLFGGNNQNDSFLSNQSKLPQNSIQQFSNYENKPAMTYNLKRHESIHDGRMRKNGPPTSTLRSRSPKSPFMKSIALTNDNTFMSNGNCSQQMLNQSMRPSKPFENTSMRDSDAYSRFLNKSMSSPMDTTAAGDNFDNWVTVFGYSPDEARYVLSYFTEIGSIREQKISNSGNWMHLRYDSKMHAVAALSRNGRIVNLATMIGVKPCDDKSVDVAMARPLVANNNTGSPNGHVTNSGNNGWATAAPTNEEQIYQQRLSSGDCGDRLGTSIINGTTNNATVNYHNLNSSLRSLTAGPANGNMSFSEHHYNQQQQQEQQRAGRPRGMLSRAMSMVFGRK